MVKNILLVVMTIVSLMFVGYAFIQKLEADKQFELAVASRIEAEKMKSSAVEYRHEVEEQRALAKEAIEALASCRKSMN
jgi:uncharacterized ion transporter superfamily protein YfcC